MAAPPVGGPPDAQRRSGPPLAVSVGVALAVAYVVVYVATLQLSGEHQRPLFDGFAPGTPYRWVNPPADFEDGNVEPRPLTLDLGIGPEGSEAAGPVSEDGQLVLNLPQGAVPPRAGDTNLRVVIRPLDPDILGLLPPGLFADGNAYKVELSYQPSGEAIDSLAKPGNIIMTVPEPAVALVYAPDGQAWQRVESVTHASINPAGTFARAGHYLGAADSPTGSDGDGDSGDTGRVVLVVAIIVALALGLGLVPVVVRRVRGAGRTDGRGRAADRRRARQSGSSRKAAKPKSSVRHPPPKKGRRSPPKKRRK